MSASQHASGDALHDARCEKEKSDALVEIHKESVDQMKAQLRDVTGSSSFTSLLFWGFSRLSKLVD